MNNRNREKTSVLKHLRRTGNIKQSCEKAGLPHRTFYEWRYKNREFAAEVRKAMIDYWNSQ